MTYFILELEDGSRYKVTGRPLKYKVYCIAPDKRVGYIKEHATDYYLKDGTKVYKCVTYFTISGAIRAMREHAGLNEEHNSYPPGWMCEAG